MVQRKSNLGAILAICGTLVALPLAIYIAAYLYSGEVSWSSNGYAVGRVFDSPWQCAVFRPLANCEAHVFRRGVMIGWFDENGDVHKARYSPYEDFVD